MSCSRKKPEFPSQVTEGKPQSLARRALAFFRQKIAPRMAASAIYSSVRKGLAAPLPIAEGIRGAYTDESGPNIRKPGPDGKQFPLARLPYGARLAHLERFLSEAGFNGSQDGVPIMTIDGNVTVANLSEEFFSRLFNGNPAHEEIEAAKRRIARATGNLRNGMPLPHAYDSKKRKIPAWELDLMREYLSRQTDGRKDN